MLFAILARFILWLLSKIQTSYFPIRFAITAMNRRAGFAVMQMSALAIAIMAILLILLLRQDLLSTWQGNIPAGCAESFMINIQGDQREGIALALQQGGLSKPDFYPMIRGRLIAVNGRDIAPSDYSEENARRLVDREFNLSYTEQLPIANRIVAGEWINGAKPQISMETGIAKTLKHQLGDQLTFEVADERVVAPITSLRKLDWGSMRVNFFVIMPPALLNNMPQSWITSYYQSLNKDVLDYTP